MMADSTDANNLNKTRSLYEGTKPGNADKSSNPAMMNELHNMNLPLLLPLNQVQIYDDRHITLTWPMFDIVLYLYMHRKTTKLPHKKLLDQKNCTSF